MTEELRGARRSIRTHLMVGLSLMLVLAGGFMQAFGPKEQVLGQVLQRVPAPAPIKVVSEGGVKK